MRFFWFGYCNIARCNFYTLVAGNHAKAYKIINSVGLKRKGFDSESILNLEKTFKLFVKSKKTKEEREQIYKRFQLI